MCICNCLKEEHCRKSLENGASCASEIYEKQGCAPKCGKCVPFIEETFFGDIVAPSPPAR